MIQLTWEGVPFPQTPNPKPWCFSIQNCQKKDYIRILWACWDRPTCKNVLSGSSIPVRPSNPPMWSIQVKEPDNPIIRVGWAPLPPIFRCPGLRFFLEDFIFPNISLPLSFHLQDLLGVWAWRYLNATFWIWILRLDGCFTKLRMLDWCWSVILTETWTKILTPTTTNIWALIAVGRGKNWWTQTTRNTWHP